MEKLNYIDIDIDGRIVKAQAPVIMQTGSFIVSTKRAIQLGQTLSME